MGAHRTGAGERVSRIVRIMDSSASSPSSSSPDRPAWRRMLPRPEPRPLLASALVIAVACALALLPPLVALWLVGGAALVAVVLMRPIVGLYLLPIFVAFGSEVDLEVHSIHVGPTDLLVAALVLAWAVRHRVQLGRALG